MSMGQTSGTALLTHDIPGGPKLVTPAEDATLPTTASVAKWKPVSKTITGKPREDHRLPADHREGRGPTQHMIGKFGLSMYLSPKVTKIAIPDGFLEPHTNYAWEVLAIERSGNQTLSSGAFQTR